MKYAFIEQYRVQYPIRRMCPVIRVSRSGYYAWRGRPESVRSRFSRDLLSEIRRDSRPSGARQAPGDVGGFVRALRCQGFVRGEHGFS